ncbi:IclR family transcriptional regulator [Parvularcula sp. LCG005]|uniref:IclR family transcriptional regulator n=1 Tax=Parvularcula sp. LCG005 TaxID=3078805 RepID=UPI002943AA0D|nr:IclR family transcriptional regulator [Parvularcula sp. LCG005]WOI52161.1 IclR family transcriptional regulator [Parvularcula sp. LCG005]
MSGNSPNKPQLSLVGPTAEPKYRAPALEKGLDILELMSAAAQPMTSTQIAEKCGKSLSEIFRMLQVLEYRGYIAVDQAGEGYVLTDRLFTLGLSRAPMKTLIASALPVMQILVQKIGQSCHLVVASGDQIVVVARIESTGDLGFSVRVGYRRRLIDSNSGLMLYGGQPEETKARWREHFSESANVDEIARFVRASAKTFERGYAMAPSEFVNGVTDISAPVMGPRGAVAALTVPYLAVKMPRATIDESREFLLEAVAAITKALDGNPSLGEGAPS